MIITPITAVTNARPEQRSFQWRQNLTNMFDRKLAEQAGFCHPDKHRITGNAIHDAMGITCCETTKVTSYGNFITFVKVPVEYRCGHCPILSDWSIIFIDSNAKKP